MMQALKGVRHVTSSTMKQAVSELSVAVPWGEIRGKVWGPDHGRPVLCLHGWADNCGTFNALLPLLPKEFRYVAVDLAGHGCSSHRPPGVLYAFPSYVMDVRRVIDALQWSKFTIIGHSMGDALYPEMVNAVVLLDSYGFLPTDPVLFSFSTSVFMGKGFDEMLQFEKKMEEEKKRVYTYKKAVERLMSVNQTLSERSAKILLERGAIQVDGGKCLSSSFLLSKGTNIARITLEQNILLPLHFNLLHDWHHLSFQHAVVTVPGDHHIHLNNPDVVAPVLSDFLQTKVLSHSDTPTNVQTSKL
uniref:Serine hydrolase like n=1 Tax=Amphilophus citrinellus TaxID=61819 RepID=A0A3Q0QZL6_AMPCI